MSLRKTHGKACDESNLPTPSNVDVPYDVQWQDNKCSFRRNIQGVVDCPEMVLFGISEKT